MSFSTKHFIRNIGWNINDIPDKQRRWQKAYPDPGYQKVVERQWELVTNLAIEQNKPDVMMEVNISTKYAGLQRFNVKALMNEKLMAEHQLVLFEPISAASSQGIIALPRRFG